MKNKILTQLLAILVTVIFLRELIRLSINDYTANLIRGKLLTGDFGSSVIPGWHVTLQLSEWELTIMACLILLLAFLVILLLKKLNYIIEKIFNLFPPLTNSKGRD